MAATLAEMARRLNSRRGRVPFLVVMSDERRLPDPTAVLPLLPPGAALVLRRHQDGAALARRLAPACRARRVLLLIANDFRLAQAVRADGLHLAEGIAAHGVLAPLLGWVRRRGAILTVAAHGRRALGRAAQLGADAALLSPVFPTASHPGAPCLGPLRFAVGARAAALPVLALGGLTPATLRRLPRGCAAGIATTGGLVPISSRP